MLATRETIQLQTGSHVSCTAASLDLGSYYNVTPGEKKLETESECTTASKVDYHITEIIGERAS